MTAERFTEIFDSLGLSRKELGADIGASAVSVGNWLRGDKIIPDDIADAMEGLLKPLVCEKEDKPCTACGECLPW